MRTTAAVLRKSELEEKISTVEVGNLQDAYRLTDEIRDLEEKIKIKKRIRDGIFDRYVSAGVREEGQYIMNEKTSEIRVLNNERFKQDYPDVFMNIAEVPLSKADELIGKKVVTLYCDLKSRVTRSVIEIPSFK